MTKLLFNMTRVFIIIIFIFISFRILKEKEYFRLFLEVISIMIFIYITRLYENKIKIFSISYIYYVIIIQIILNISPYYYTKKILVARFGNSVIPFVTDYFYFYFYIYIIISFIIIFYLLKIKSLKKIDIKLKLKQKEAISTIILGTFLMLMSSKIDFLENGLFIPTLSLFFIFILKYRKSYFLKFYMLLLCFYILKPYFLYRYMIAEMIFPLILGYIFYLNESRIKKRFLVFFSLGIVGGCLYGVFSEITKLNYFYKGSYSFGEIIYNFDYLIIFIKRQIYRVFGIWIHTGGNILDYMQNRNYFYGITYIKNLAKYLNFKYVNLAHISAKYIGCTYAQPGIIVEGYANFGILGAIFSGIFPFFYLELLLKEYILKKRILILLLMIIPCSKVILDGGGILSIFHSIILIAINYYFIVIFKLLIKK